MNAPRVRISRYWPATVGLVAVTAALSLSVVVAPLPAQAVELGDRLDPARVAKLNELAQAAPAQFAGVSVDESSRTVTVRYPAGAGPDVARQLLADLGAAATAATEISAGDSASLTVRLVPARYSLSELRTVADRITTDTSWLPGGAALLSKWYVDVDANAVMVGLSEVTPQARAAAARTFGDRVHLIVAERAQATSSRLSDFAPWAGGDRISITKRDGSQSSCTSGFAIHRIRDPADQQMLTAGHCAGQGDQVFNGGTLIGTIVTESFAQGGVDAAYIGGQQYAPFIYMGGPASTFGRRTVGTTTPVKGLGVCTSGATTGQSCGGVVTGTDVCVVFTDNRLRCHFAEADSTDRSIINQPGDSGGPVVQLSGADGVNVVGLIIGGGRGGQRVDFYPLSMVIPGGWAVSTG
jgi:streptogrisin C